MLGTRVSTKLEAVYGGTKRKPSFLLVFSPNCRAGCTLRTAAYPRSYPGWREKSTIQTVQSTANDTSQPKNRHDEMATTSATIAAVCDEQDDGAAWLVSLASADERGCSFSQTQTCVDDAVARCAAVIKDAEANVYRRGLAVLALGRTLGRELGRSQSGDSVAVGAFRQVHVIGSCSGCHTFS